MIRNCKNCSVVLIERHKIKFCSNRCQQQYQYELFIEAWKRGNASGTVGISVRTISGHLRRYLSEKYGEKCVLCGWNVKHPLTHKVPLEVDHIDGNAENSTESNLRLLCPNCHSLTPFFRGLNKGKGRKWRMDKYIADKAALSL
jgi:predicted restriction endonuclease